MPVSYSLWSGPLSTPYWSHVRVTGKQQLSEARTSLHISVTSLGKGCVRFYSELTLCLANIRIRVVLVVVTGSFHWQLRCVAGARRLCTAEETLTRLRNVMMQYTIVCHHRYRCGSVWTIILSWIWYSAWPRQNNCRVGRSKFYCYILLDPQLPWSRTETCNCIQMKSNICGLCYETHMDNANICVSSKLLVVITKYICFMFDVPWGYTILKRRKLHCFIWVRHQYHNFFVLYVMVECKRLLFGDKMLVTTLLLFFLLRFSLYYT